MNRKNISLSHFNFKDDDEKIEWLLKFIESSVPQLFMYHLRKYAYNSQNSFINMDI